MAQKPNQPALPVAFDARVKCCTFHPHLVNFLVGGILADAESRGTKVLAERIAAGPGVTPLGIVAPALYATVYAEGTKRAGVFGRTTTLLCPFYVAEGGGLCGIYRHREAVCSTWYCKHEYGPRGRVVWLLIRNLLQAIERMLSWHCLTALGLDIEQTRAIVVGDVTRKPLDEYDLNRRMNPTLQRAIWGRHLGHEKEFFVACAKIVAPLRWPDILGLGGPELRALAAVVKHSYDRLPKLPATIRRGPQVNVTVGADSARLTSNGAYEHIDVPLSALTALGRVEGQSVDAAIKQLTDEGVPFTRELVAKLYNFNALTD